MCDRALLRQGPRLLTLPVVSRNSSAGQGGTRRRSPLVRPTRRCAGEPRAAVARRLLGSGKGGAAGAAGGFMRKAHASKATTPRDHAPEREGVYKIPALRALSEITTSLSDEADVERLLARFLPTT